MYFVALYFIDLKIKFNSFEKQILFGYLKKMLGSSILSQIRFKKVIEVDVQFIDFFLTMLHT